MDKVDDDREGGNGWRQTLAVDIRKDNLEAVAAECRQMARSLAARDDRDPIKSVRHHLEEATRSLELAARAFEKIRTAEEAASPGVSAIAGETETARLVAYARAVGARFEADYRSRVRPGKAPHVEAIARQLFARAVMGSWRLWMDTFPRFAVMDPEAKRKEVRQAETITAGLMVKVGLLDGGKAEHETMKSYDAIPDGLPPGIKT